MTTYANQLRALAKALYDSDDVPTGSVIITLNEAAEKIDMLDGIVQAAMLVVDTYDDRARATDRAIRELDVMLKGEYE